MSDIRTTLIAAAVGAGAALGASFLDKWLERGNFDHQFSAQSRGALVDKRFDLIKGYSAQINAVDYMSILDSWNQQIAGIGESVARRCAEEHDTDYAVLACIQDRIIDRNLKYKSELSARHADFVSTVQMSKLLFGPKVREKLSSLQKGRWWTTDETVHIAVLEAMREELYHFD